MVKSWDLEKQIQEGKGKANHLWIVDGQGVGELSTGVEDSLRAGVIWVES